MPAYSLVFVSRTVGGGRLRSEGSTISINYNHLTMWIGVFLILFSKEKLSIELLFSTKYQMLINEIFQYFSNIIIKININLYVI